jgi:hypothetical protein
MPLRLGQEIQALPWEVCVAPPQLQNPQIRVDEILRGQTGNKPRFVKAASWPRRFFRSRR